LGYQNGNWENGVESGSELHVGGDFIGSVTVVAPVPTDGGVIGRGTMGIGSDCGGYKSVTGTVTVPPPVYVPGSRRNHNLMMKQGKVRESP
jgi:hypothetical protein